MAHIHGGQVIARALRAEGVDTVFTLTGGHILPILDGCVLEGIRVVDVRHELTAINAAEAYTRLTGTLGVAAVTAGPGMTNAMTGVASASSSETPVLLIGGRHFIRQEAMGGLQEMNHPDLFGSIAAWAATAWETHRLSDYVATAARRAFAGRGGPVVLDVPLDVQADMVDEETIRWPVGHRSMEPRAAARASVVAAVKLLAAAARPMIFAGGGYRGDTGELASFAERLQAPVYLQSVARGSLPADHAFLGSRARSAALAGADLVIALGVDWDFRSGYGRKLPDASVVQVDANPAKVGWNRAADVGIVADGPTVLAQLLDDPDWGAGEERTWLQQILDMEDAKRREADGLAASDMTPVFPERFAKEVAAWFGPDAIVAVDGGDIVSTTAKWLEVSTPGHLLDPGPFGSLGTGPPFALAAKVAFPEKRVGIVFGDGGFGFNGMEYDTFVRLGLPIIGVVGNDGAWSNIKTLHAAFYPDRVVAADLGIRPYHAMVEGLGGYGEFVDHAAQIRPALDRAAASGKPALVNVHIAEVPRMSSNYAQ